MSLTALLKKTKSAAAQLASLSSKEKNAALAAMRSIIKENKSSITDENKKDIACAQKNDRASAFIDRLTLTPKRFAEMLRELQTITRLPDPSGEIIEKRT